MTSTLLPVVGYEGHYSVSSTGDVFTHKGGKTRILKPDLDTQGYRRVCLCKDGVGKVERVHRLVCTAFNPKSDPALNVVNHLNGIKTSNEASNLEWTTDFGNRAHATANGLMNKNHRGSKHPSAKLNEDQVRQIRLRRATHGTSYRALGSEFGVSHDTIIHVCLRRTWTHVKDA